ncbi:type II toxin-antitoxin system RelE/ParE family toxin [Runella sp.]|jgi:mRNA interferase RelE/StbE|uniref:type II toxin-antitoxin system RelE family toxin n=1 Tax=Runella sp. TaxID=1960881 RepID=UPI00262ADB70|nr:type II toxin-antitoxin system RelE/ParE family toxin [Runella sp.]
MKVEFLAKFDKDLDKLTSQRVKDDIISAIENVEQAQKIAGIQNIKKLKGAKIAYRIKIGEYRIGLYIEGKTVEFARVVHRKDIYKFFP